MNDTHTLGQCPLLCQHPLICVKHTTLPFLCSCSSLYVHSTCINYIINKANNLGTLRTPTSSNLPPILQWSCRLWQPLLLIMIPSVAIEYIALTGLPSCSQWTAAIAPHLSTAVRNYPNCQWIVSQITADTSGMPCSSMTAINKLLIKVVREGKRTRRILDPEKY